MQRKSLNKSSLRRKKRENKHRIKPHRIETDPTLEFLVIVNPNSGPGGISPDANYAREVARLNGYPNVYTIGYIRVDYCRRALHEACTDVAQYAAWSEHYDTTRLGVRGIFVDETPNNHSPERVEYLRFLTRYIKESPGILSDRFVPRPRSKFALTLGT